MTLLTLAPGIRVRGKNACVRCREELARGARVMPVWIVAVAGTRGLVLQARTDVQAPQNEYVHVRCGDPSHLGVAAIFTAARPTLDTDMHTKPIEPRGDDAHCITCKRVFARGDRVLLHYIVQGVERDPETTAIAAKVLGEYEVGHADCNDPRLDHGVLA